MKKRTKNLIMCIALLIILGGGYAIFELTRPSPEYIPEPEPFTTYRLISYDPQTGDDRRWQDVSTATIAIDGEETIYFHGDQRGNWYSVTRPHLTIWQHEVNIILSFFSGLQADEIFMEDPSPQLLAELGLSPATATITVEYTDGTVYTAFIGAPTVDNRYHYIKIDGNPTIYLIQPLRVSRFFEGYDRFLDRDLPTIDLSGITALQVNQHGQPYIDIQILEQHMFSDFPDFFEITGLGMV